MADRFYLYTPHWNIHYYSLGSTRTYIEVALQGKGIVCFSRNNNLCITDNNLEASESLEE